jgi:hypothetical protein
MYLNRRFINMANTTLQGSDAIVKKLNEIAESMGGGSVSVGFLDGATYPDGTPVAAVAFWNEYGRPSQGQPPRPFFRRMINEESPTWPGKMAKLAEMTDYDGPRVLALMGEDINGALKQSINDFQNPGLAPSTIAAKGFAKPLIDSAVMVNSTGYEVDE